MRLLSFAFKDSMTPISVPLPKLSESGAIPPFIASGNWIKGLCSKVLKNANLMDSENPRVTAVIVTRCSRGGKTSSLHELIRKVRAVDDSYALIYVSFNSETPVEEWENENPLGALCKRIVFTSLNQEEQGTSRHLQFDNFKTQYDVSPASVVKWLDTEKCILVVDELHKITMNEEIASSLKHNFLLRPGRGLVFSSHVVSLNSLLCEFMDGQGSGREIRTYSLPHIISMSDTNKSSTQVHCPRKRCCS